MNQNNRILDQDQGGEPAAEVEEAPADSSEDPATPEDFEEEGMGIAPKE